jgi:GNAT superfamily N-acetyltransferase
VEPDRLYFSASKDVEPGQNPTSRARLYERMVERYAKSMGYDVVVDDRRGHTMFVLDKDQSLREESFNGIDIDMDIEGDEIMVTAMGNGRELGHVLFVDEGEYLMPQDLEVDERFQGQGIAAAMYNYVKNKGYTIRRSGQQTDAGAGFWGKHRPEQNVWEDAGTKINFTVQSGGNKFATTMTVNGEPAGVYQYNADTGRSIAEVYTEYQGKGLGKVLVLHAIYTAAKLGMDFVEDESRTSQYDNVLDSLSDNGYIVDDDGYWYVTGAGEQFLKGSLKENFADGKVKGRSRPGRVKRAGASCNGSVTSLRQRAKNASGEKAKMYHWCANMKSGRKK